MGETECKHESPSAANFCDDCGRWLSARTGKALPTIEEMSGSIDYGGRMIINEDNEPAILIDEPEGRA